ncbi:MAG TPA: TonB-dependent receptor, partial [Caulobacteraceae bacterium]|nr:TonB-dependent receptor [Caulobacteraceae bacterium]
TLTPSTVVGPGTRTASAFLAPGQSVTVNPRQVNEYHEEPWWYSNEINITSSGKGPTQWIVGLYQFREGSNYKGIDARMPDQPQLATPFRYNVVGGAIVGVVPAAANPQRQYALNTSDNVTWSDAVFGQVSQKFGDKFTLTGGLRYTWDRRKSTEQVRYVCFLAPTCPVAQGFFPAIDLTPQAVSFTSTDPSIQQQTVYDPATGLATRRLKNNWSALTGTVKLDYQPDEDSLYYLSYTRGYKAGGFNAGTINASPSTDPEFINAYELGVKKTIGARVQANASAFWYDYTDVQVPLSEVNPASGITITNFYNLPKTRSRGFELETIYFPTDRLQLLFNYAYLDAKIVKACCFIDPQDPTGFQPGAQVVSRAANNTANQDLAGELFPNSTPHRVTLNGQYRWDLLGGSLTGSLSYIWRSATYSSQFNRWYNKTDAWGQADARLVWRGGEHRDITLIGYVKNIFDEEGPVSASGTRSNTAPTDPTQPYDILSQSFTINTPRTFGFEIQKRF